jgi:hypothetical protein
MLMMDVVRHTHLQMSYGPWLNRIFLCPYWHQLRHSIEPRHYNRNYGLLLSVWDEMFGTLAIPERGENFTFGLSDNEHDEYQSLARLRVVPLVKIWGLGRGWVRRNLPIAAFTFTADDQAKSTTLNPRSAAGAFPMSTKTEVAIIGAGPFGLSLAAHLAAERVGFRIFRKPMQFWRTQMPEGSVLKTEGSQEVTILLSAALETPPSVSIIELQGPGKELWRDVDAAAHVEAERSARD